MRRILFLAATFAITLLALQSLRGLPSSAELQNTIITESNSRPVLVNFGAPWCPSCMKMKPELETLTDKLGDQLFVQHVDVDEYPKLTQTYEITGIPHSLVFHKGELVAENLGFMTTTDLEKWTAAWTRP